MKKLSATAYYAGIAPLVFCLFLYGCDLPTAQDSATEIIFVTTGETFAPVLVVDGTPEIIWTFSNGDTSDSATPSVSFTTAESREQRLKVTPWSAVTRINIGYDRGDGGSDTIEIVADQKIAEVRNLELVSSSLKQWCSSYNTIASLDFSDFTALETIECFKSQSLTSVTLDNCPSLKRACFEDCSLEALDLRGCPNLEDLRGALNCYSTIVFPDLMPSIWHICVRENAKMTDDDLFASTARFPVIRELLIWEDSQKGALKIPSTGSGKVEITANVNAYTSIDFSGALRDSASSAAIDLHKNNISSVDITGCSQITSLNLADNALDASTVHSVLETLDSLGRENGIVILSGNAVPPAAAQTAIDSLEGKGWTVTVSVE